MDHAWQLAAAVTQCLEINQNFPHEAEGFTEVLTSTLAHERGQFLYRKLGYQDCGALILPNEPLEIIMRKRIADDDASN